MTVARVPRRWPRVLVAGLLLAGCRGDVSTPVVIDLARLFETIGSGAATTRIDFTSAADEALLQGWTGPREASDGSRGRLIEHAHATVRFRAGSETRAATLLVDRTLLRPPGAARRPLGVRVFVNGVSVGGLPPHQTSVRLSVPAAALKPGRNVLGFRYLHPPRTSDEQVARHVYRAVDILWDRPPAPGPMLDGADTLVLPPGTTARFYLRAPAGARLRADLTGASGRLAVRSRSDGGIVRTLAVVPVEAPRALDVPLPLPAGVIAEVEIAGEGNAPLRLARPRVEGTIRRPAPAGAGGERPATGPRNLLLYVADTLRADRLGVYGCERATSPHLDRFAGTAVVFEHVIAEAPWTRPSVATVLTGRVSSDHGAATLRDGMRGDVDTLAGILRREGWATGAFVTNVNVAPAFGLDRGFDEYTFLPEDFESTTVHVPAPTLHERGLAWLDGHRDRPFFLYLHASDPHAPYAPPSAQRERFVPDGLRITLDPARPMDSLRRRARGPAADDLAYLRGLYDAEVATLDDAFGALLAALETRGLLESTVVAFVGDHGEEFHEHGDFEHGRTVFQEVVHVPLIVRVPGGRGARAAGLARHADVMPTLLALLGLPVPSVLPGRALLAPDGSVLPGVVEEAHSTTRFAGVALTAIVVTPWKVIVPDRPDVRVEVYDLARDPAERENLADGHPVLAGYARQRAAELDGGAAVARDGRAPIEPETLQRLRSLGYVVD